MLISQTFVAFFLVIYFIAISIGFVHRFHVFWQRSPLINHWWTVTSICLIISDIVFCLAEILLFVEDKSEALNIPLPLIALSLSWIVVLIPLNTVVKRKEIKANNRQQRRARLDFNTKLGMNSPF